MYRIEVSFYLGFDAKPTAHIRVIESDSGLDARILPGEEGFPVHNRIVDGNTWDEVSSQVNQILDYAREVVKNRRALASQAPRDRVIEL